MTTLFARRMTAVTLATVALVGAAGVANATYSYKSYDTVVGKFNGNGYSGEQQKTDAYEDGQIKSSSVGGPYKVDARLENSNGAAVGSSWVRVDDGSDKALPNLINRGWQTRVHFSNDLGTRVNVAVKGKFIAR